MSTKHLTPRSKQFSSNEHDLINYHRQSAFVDKLNNYHNTNEMKFHHNYNANHNHMKDSHNHSLKTKFHLTKNQTKLKKSLTRSDNLTSVSLDYYSKPNQYLYFKQRLPQTINRQTPTFRSSNEKECKKSIKFNSNENEENPIISKEEPHLSKSKGCNHLLAALRAQDTISLNRIALATYRPDMINIQSGSSFTDENKLPLFDKTNKLNNSIENYSVSNYKLINTNHRKDEQNLNLDSHSNNSIVNLSNPNILNSNTQKYKNFKQFTEYTNQIMNPNISTKPSNVWLPKVAMNSNSLRGSDLLSTNWTTLIKKDWKSEQELERKINFINTNSFWFHKHLSSRNPNSHTHNTNPQSVRTLVNTINSNINHQSITTNCSVNENKSYDQLNQTEIKDHRNKFKKRYFDSPQSLNIELNCTQNLNNHTPKITNPNLIQDLIPRLNINQTNLLDYRNEIHSDKRYFNVNSESHNKTVNTTNNQRSNELRSVVPKFHELYSIHNINNLKLNEINNSKQNKNESHSNGQQISHHFKENQNIHSLNNNLNCNNNNNSNSNNMNTNITNNNNDSEHEAHNNSIKLIGDLNVESSKMKTIQTEKITNENNSQISSHCIRPMSPKTVLTLHSKKLTTFEKQEILDFPKIWYFGMDAHKIDSVLNVSNNNGYDDESGGYLKVTHDHLAYRFQTLETLGKGSFGRVIRAIDHQNGSSVAIKIIRNKKRFHQQAQIEVSILETLKKADPQNLCSIIHIKEYFTFRNHLCIVFDLLGLNLYDVLRKNDFRGFTTNSLKKITIKLLECLCLLRKLGIIHCDLKPENILIGLHNTSEIRVIDFGSSCYANKKTYTYIQSRFYRAPEVILGVPYGMPIDMWSLGCILPELYTGRPIFPGENENEQLACIMEVIGLPPDPILERSSRRKVFFDSRGSPRYLTNSRGRKRIPGSQTLGELIKTMDSKFLDLISRCFTWIPEDRITPFAAIQHEWIKQDNVQIKQINSTSSSTTVQSLET